MEHRNEYLEYFASPAAKHLTIDLSRCEWIDLRPLIDLFLQVTAFARAGGRIAFAPPDASQTATARALRFLLDTGFLEGLATTSTQPPPLTIISPEGRPTTFAEFAEQLHPRTLPPQLINYDTIFRLRLIDTRLLAARDDVFDSCRTFRDECLSDGRAEARGIPVPLIYQATTFFNAILPELIDNTRIHKRQSEPAIAALYLRFRRHEESLTSNSRLVERTLLELTPLKKATRHLWHFDFIEAIYADLGPTIQDSWLERWYAANKEKRRTIPKLGNIRVDGKNGDQIIVEAVFNQNASSLPDSERDYVTLTGLHSVKEAISDSDWYFSVDSGRRSITVMNEQSSNERRHVLAKSTGVFATGPGVSFLFRFTSTHGRSLAHWYDGRPTSTRDNSAWWETKNSTQIGTQIHLLSEYILPSTAKAGDTLICRATHVPTARQLKTFLQEVKAKRCELIFAEIPTSIALNLLTFINGLIQYDQLSIRTLIVTDTLRVIAPGGIDRNTLAAFSGDANTRPTAEPPKYWWQEIGCPIKSLADLFATCRTHDSEIFWRYVASDQHAFLHAPIQWTDDLILKGGFLFFNVARRHPELLRLARRRLVLSAYLLGASRVVPATDSMRFMTSEVSQHASFERHDGPTVVLADVVATGSTLSKSFGDKSYAWLTVLSYPEKQIENRTAQQFRRDRFIPSALEWLPSHALGSDPARHSSASIDWARVGNSEHIRKRQSGLIDHSARRDAGDAYAAWQSQSLLHIGHYSHGRNHYFAWLNLFGFLSGRSNERGDMLSFFAETISRIRPAFVLYDPNEVSELLVKQLVEWMDRSDNTRGLVRSDRALPTHSGPNSSSSDRYLGSAVIAAIDPLERDAPILFVSDAMVTGASIRGVRSSLRKMGFKSVH